MRHCDIVGVWKLEKILRVHDSRDKLFVNDLLLSIMGFIPRTW